MCEEAEAVALWVPELLVVVVSGTLVENSVRVDSSELNEVEEAVPLGEVPVELEPVTGGAPGVLDSEIAGTPGVLVPEEGGVDPAGGLGVGCVEGAEEPAGGGTDVVSIGGADEPDGGGAGAPLPEAGGTDDSPEKGGIGTTGVVSKVVEAELD